jgi:NADPH-dependent 2,4-dienoyl-CoA reductase/sulfur reductase-like enzyme
VTGRRGAPAGIVVVGAGIAGISAVEHLRAQGYDGRLTVIGAEDELPYDRPPLSKELLLGQRGPDDIRLRPAAWYDDNDVRLRLGVPVRALVPGAAGVTLADGGVERADLVLLATGGRPRTLAVPGAGHPAVTVLRTLPDGLALRDRIRPGIRLGVVGAGLVGAEVTASATALGAEVTLIDPFARPLERAVGPDIAEALHARHRRHGVRLVEDAVAAVEDRGEGVRLRLGHRADPVDCDLVVVGVGIERDLSLATGAGLATDGGILVDAGQRTSHPQVFAAGDVARTVGPTGPLPPVEHWDAALREGRAAAAAMLGRPAPPARAPWFWSDRYGLHLEVVGELQGAEVTVVRGALDSDAFTVLAVRAGRCVGAASVNRAAEIRAVRRLIERGVPVDLDRLRDESVDLRGLAREPSTSTTG